MKIVQQPKFQPITITLETAEEAEALWDAIRIVESRGPVAIKREPKHDKLLRNLSNWFSNQAQLGGG